MKNLHELHNELKKAVAERKKVTKMDDRNTYSRLTKIQKHLEALEEELEGVRIV